LLAASAFGLVSIAVWQFGGIDNSDIRVVKPPSQDGGITGTASKSTYSDRFVSGSQTLSVKSPANVRELPDSTVTQILRRLPLGTSVRGIMVAGVQPNERWLKLDNGGYVRADYLEAQTNVVDFDLYRNLPEFSSRGPQEDSAVWSLTRSALADESIAAQIADSTGVGINPEVGDSRLLFWGICARLCLEIDDDFSYSVIITQTQSGQVATVCFERARLRQRSVARWYESGHLSSYVTDECPSSLAASPITPLGS
jgi:hypothetical protein